MKDFKRIGIKFTLMACIIVFISILGIAAYSTRLLSTSDAAFIDKIERLASLKGEKAVFIGGSATNFGIQAEAFEKSTGIPSVNMGLNAGVSFGSYIDSVKPYLYAGDIVFLMPEYHYYEKDYASLGENDVYMSVFFNRNLLYSLRFQKVIPFLSAFVNAGLKSWSSLCNETIRDAIFQEGYGVYYRRNVNEWGDFIGHKGLPAKDHTGLPLTLKQSDFLSLLAADISELNENGIQVYYLFPPYDITEYGLYSDYIEQLYSSVWEELDVNILYAPQDSVYPTEDFFDTVYHLRWEVAQEHTSMIISKFQLQNS